MTERKLKYSVGVFLIVSHFGLIIYSIKLYFMNGFNIEEFTTLVAIIAPMFAGYTTSILAFIIKNSRVSKDVSEKVTVVYSVLSFAIPLVLVAIIGAAIRFKAYNTAFENFEDFKRFLLIVESLFAAYVGMFVYSLFEKRDAVGVPPNSGDSPGTK